MVEWFGEDAGPLLNSDTHFLSASKTAKQILTTELDWESWFDSRNFEPLLRDESGSSSSIFMKKSCGDEVHHSSSSSCSHPNKKILLSRWNRNWKKKINMVCLYLIVLMM